MSAEPESTRRVLEAISKALGVDVGTLRSRARTVDVVAARRVAIVILRDRCGSSYRQIGTLLGRSHWNVIEVHRRARAWQPTVEFAEHVGRMMDQENPRTRRAVEDIEEVFRRAREDAGVATQPRARPR